MHLDQNNLVWHRPLIDNIPKIEKFYSDKDGVDVTYVCTTQLPKQKRDIAHDVYYRETPHPQFGNNYFGLTKSFEGNMWICDADSVEELEFICASQKDKETYYYSTHAHDFWTPPNVNWSIDGGRDYIRMVGDGIFNTDQKTFVIKNGKMKEK